MDIILLNFLERSMLIIFAFFLVTKISRVKEIFTNEQYKTRDYIIICSIFSAFAVFSTYFALDYYGSLINVRNVVIISGGIMFGPIVGITTGIVSGVHRYFIDINGVTSIPCLISSLIAGGISGIIYKNVPKNNRWIYGILGGMLTMTIEMVLILILSKDYYIAHEIVLKISIPMILGQFSIGIIVRLVQSIEEDKERIAAKQSKLALEIANKTLPYFRNLDKDGLNKICTIIKDDINADAVSITDKKYVLAYVGLGEEKYINGYESITDCTKKVIESGNISIRNDDNQYNDSVIKSSIIIPLREKNEVVGTLKIYYKRKHKITYSLQALAVGLSQLISTLMEISRVEEIKEIANKSEIKALQAQINPHFLFNALNAISACIRIDANEARNIVMNLANFLRYNLEISDEFISLKKELNQVDAYVNIERARFGDRLNIIYDVDDIDIKIPSLIIQPLVENAIVHGILKSKGKGYININVKEYRDKVKIEIIDSGVGIEEDIIRKIYQDDIENNKIGLYNVHKRLKLIYGEGLVIERLEKGTRIAFLVERI
ncbi:LytS/YhcK type 5TM receptor domain-containing protein [Paraclostridium ghonii]|uniref:LytS/YhcK type 5TM receptor domain-containing protein n=1 Tax=Paraclostridium ghonii TaxID=29358 RepID=UPI00202CBA0E|nr:LytS/YhcK type 5TM receptor domain-containing protein [Paeniclostridium ghonii]MCM0164916.1 histidine kinase [Paeniclostridium ghonii]